MRLRNIPRANEVIANHRVVVQAGESIRGSWHTVFDNNHPIHIEIGMGKGRFLMELAVGNPEINYVGIERYTSILLRAVERWDQLSEDSRPGNLRFLNIDAAKINTVFARGEVEKIYLNFSDPWPKARHAQRRLTAGVYWKRYGQILEQGQTVEFKTDNQELFAFSLEQLHTTREFAVVAQTRDLHRDPDLRQGNVMTEYEEKFSGLGHPICKLIAERK